MLEKYFKNQAAFITIVGAILVASIICIFTLPIKMYPNIAKPYFRFNAWHSDIRTTSDFYNIYGSEIAQSIEALSGLTEFTQSYSSGWAQFHMTFDWDSDKEELEEKLETIFTNLEGRSGNKFGYYNFSSFSNSSGTMRLAVSHKTYTTEELRNLLRSSLIRDIKRLKNVEKVNMWGWSTTQPLINIDRDKLLSYKLDFGSLLQKIRSATKYYNAGEAGKGRSNRKVILIQADIEELNKLLDLIIYQDKNLTVRMRDIATLGDLDKGSTDKVFRLNGKDANIMNVVLKTKGDVKRTCDQIKKIVQKFKASHPDSDYRILINPATFIDNAIINLIINALFGGVVATLVILFFLGSFRNTIIIAISIPFCVIAAFILMKVAGVSISLISLGGMAIGVGMIVDSSIVSLENIHRRLAQGYDNKIKQITKAVREVALPITASTITSLVVFLPILFTKSYTKAILGDLALTVIFTLTISLFIAIFFIPFLSYNFISNHRFKIPSKVLFLTKAPELYQKALSKVLNRKRFRVTVFTSLGVLFILSLFLIPHITKSIIAKPATKLTRANGNLYGNTDPDVTRKSIKRVESVLKEMPQVVNYTAISWGPNHSGYNIEIQTRHQYEEVKAHLKKELPRTPSFSFTLYPWDPGGLPLPSDDDMVLHLSGERGDQIEALAESIRTKVQNMEDPIWSNEQPWRNRRENIHIDFYPWVEKSYKDSVRQYLRTASNFGYYLNQVVDDGKIRWLHARFLDNQRVTYLDDVRSFPVLYQNKIVPLKALGKLSMGEDKQKSIFIQDGVRTHSFFFNFKVNRKKNEKILRDFISKEKQKFPVQVNYQEKDEEVNESYHSFIQSLLISIGLVFVVMVVFFNSFNYPLIILATIPFAITGAIIGLFVTDSTISLNSMLGTILLSGLVVNNAILFIDYYKGERAKGLDANTAILNAASRRFRPILMTTLTTLLGIFPIALALGESGEILQPLGISVFSGLLISTMLTLFLIPCLLKTYSLWAKS